MRTFQSIQMVIVAASVVLAASMASATTPSVVPVPVKMQAGEGVFAITPDTVVETDDASAFTARQLVDYLKPVTGFVLNVAATPVDAKSRIVLSQDSALSGLGKEGYRLVVTPKSIRLSAADQAGMFYGVQTLRQLLPVKDIKAMAWTVPCVTIEDQPRFAWRGLMLDSGHDFQRKEFVLRFIDLMALHKFNLFHWHLTDLGTWSFEINGWPKLLDPATHRTGVKPGHYTQDEIREVVRYAAERHITILPEIDMPGHASPALLAHPELDCPLPLSARRCDNEGCCSPLHPELDCKRPLSAVPNPIKGRPWSFCVGNEKTYAFLEDVLTQVTELFPGKMIHIGGDECPKGRWLKCPLCQARMKAENLKNGEELQSYFIKRIEKFLQSKGRRMIGWDEILEGGLAPDATVMSWRGMEGGIAAAKSGHDVVMAPHKWTYFDKPNTPVEMVYSFEPMPNELSEEQAKHILGAQAQMWTDGHPSEEVIDARVYPRAVALSEVLWSPAASRDYAAFSERLRSHLPRLAALGVNYKPFDTGTVVGEWGTQPTTAAPASVQWPLTKGVAGAGRYAITFHYEHGKSRYEIHGVEILQEGKVLASDKHHGFTGASNKDNVFRVELPQLSGGALILRASVSTDSGPDSHGRINLLKELP